LVKFEADGMALYDEVDEKEESLIDECASE